MIRNSTQKSSPVICAWSSLNRQKFGPANPAFKPCNDQASAHIEIFATKVFILHTKRGCV